MDGAALEAAFRQRVDDAEGRELYDSATILGWAAEAEREACVRARLIFDTTSDFLDYPVSIGQDSIELSPLVHQIDSMSITIAGVKYKLASAGADDLQDRPMRDARPWLAARVGRTLMLWPRPVAAGTVHISCYRFPRFPIESPSDDPEIPEQYHEGLVDWMTYRAYSMKDSEKEDPARAAQSLQAFETRFGVRRTADVYRKHAEKRRITTTMVEF